MHTVSELARILELSEFQIFEKAYVHWYGCVPEAIQLEREFVHYITQQQALPVYVQNFLRQRHFLIA